MRLLSSACAALVCLGTAGGASAQTLNLRGVSVSSPQAAVAGDTIDIGLSIEAQGPAAPAPFRYTLHLSPSGALSGARLIYTSADIQLSAQETGSFSELITLPNDVTGTHRVVVAIDGAGVISEFNELDNVVRSPAPIRIRARAPDLVARSVALPRLQHRAGETVRVSFEIDNNGEEPATVDVSAYLSSNTFVSSSDPVLGTTQVTVPAGQRVGGEISGLVPAEATTGDYRIGIVVDPNDAVDEIVEINNGAVAPQTFNVFSDELELLTTSVPDGAVFVSYYLKLDALGGDGHFQYRVVGGDLPVGISLSADGELQGTPTESGQRSFDIEVSSNGSTRTRTFTSEIFESGLDLVIATPSLGNATLALPYSAAIVVAGGEPPYTFTISVGRLPPGLDLTEDGIINGIPQQDGQFSFTVHVADGLGGVDESEYTLSVVAPGVVLASGETAELPVGQQIHYALGATGGLPPYQWIALSSPPSGLVITEDGFLSGTPDKVGVHPVLVEVRDSSKAGLLDTGIIRVVISEGAPFEILTRQLPPVGTRDQLRVRLETMGGTPPMYWRLAAGERLPRGFELVQDDDPGPNSEAFIVGTSVSPLFHGFTLQVTDAVGRAREVVLAINIERPTAANNIGAGCRCVGTPSEGPIVLLGFGFVVLLAWRRRRLR